MAEHAADHGAVEIGAVANYADHQHTYRSFLQIAKYVSGAIAVLLILMAFFLI
jgi:hypothetical protein